MASTAKCERYNIQLDYSTSTFSTSESSIADTQYLELHTCFVPLRLTLPRLKILRLHRFAAMGIGRQSCPLPASSERGRVPWGSSKIIPLKLNLTGHRDLAPARPLRQNLLFALRPARIVNPLGRGVESKVLLDQAFPPLSGTQVSLSLRLGPAPGEPRATWGAGSPNCRSSSREDDKNNNTEAREHADNQKIQKVLT
jgi:hypothetical protein